MRLGHGSVLSERELEERYCEFLNEIYGVVKIAGYEYETARALAEIDPTAFRCGYSDWISFEIDDGRIVEISGEYHEIEENEL
jgi:hypothetical protein